MSNRDRKKPPSQRRGRREPPTPGQTFRQAMEAPPCRLCGEPAAGCGVWIPTGPIARYFGAEGIVYTICDRCRARPDSVAAVEESLIAERMAEARPTVNPPEDEWDIEALNRISTTGGSAIVDGVKVPIVYPLSTSPDRQEFDRLVCAAGLKKFLRPFLDDPPAPGASHVMVEELSPGVRARKPVESFPAGSLN